MPIPEANALRPSSSESARISMCPPVDKIGLNNMDSGEDLAALTNELFRRIGRNLMNFQRVEGMLKFLVANGQLRGPIKELSDIRAAQHTSVQRTTMGLLAGRFVDELLSDAGDPEEPSTPASDAWFSFKMTFESDAAASAELREGLRALVDERNDLVHHLQSRWDSTSVESTRALARELDEQRERLIPLYDHLQRIVRACTDGLKAYGKFLHSPQGSQVIELLWLRQSPLVRLLGECATNQARADGWVALATAGHILRQQVPEHVASLKDRYGYSSLKRLLIATDMFDIQDEPTARGFRTMYRLKPNGSSAST
jgi:hypothetical protein